MEDSIESALEKIKVKEHDNEIKLKEKRTYETMVVSFKHRVRETLTHAAKLKHDYTDILSRIDVLGSRLGSEKSRCRALTELLENAKSELQSLQHKSMQGMSNVWNTHSSLCKSVQEVSDQCDVWALLSKPKSIQIPIAKKITNESVTHFNENVDKLNNAIERKRKVLAERDRLQNEPESGEEFLRIRNALRYSENMAANYK